MKVVPNDNFKFGSERVKRGLNYPCKQHERLQVPYNVEPVLRALEDHVLYTCTLYHKLCLEHNELLRIIDTVDSRYLELGYLEFCETRSVYLNQIYILIASPTIIWRWRLFCKSKLPKVQINLHFG